MGTYDFDSLTQVVGSPFVALGSDKDSGTKLERGITRRDILYTDLLDAYTDITKIRNQVKEVHKWIFFWLIIGVAIWFLFILKKMIGRFLKIEDVNLLIQSIPVLITGFVSFLSTIIVIPATITKFLFNTKEDENITSVILHTQEHDTTAITLLKERFEKKQEGLEDYQLEDFLFEEENIG